MVWRIALLCVASQCGPRVVAKRQLDIDLEEPRRILRKYFGTLDPGQDVRQTYVRRLGSMSQEDQAAFAKAIGFTFEEWENYLETVASKTPEEYRALQTSMAERTATERRRPGGPTLPAHARAVLRPRDRRGRPHL